MIAHKLFRLLWVIVVFRLVAYLLNMICLKLRYLSQISYMQVINRKLNFIKYLINPFIVNGCLVCLRKFYFYQIHVF